MLPELQKFGFTRNEANVYLAALKFGSSSVQQLANATGLNRITVHSIVEKFEHLQVFQRTYEGKRRKVHALDPKYLQNILRKEEEVVSEKKQSLASILPSMRDMFRRTQRGMEVTTYQGEEGYVQICEDVLATKAEMLEYANLDALMKVIGPYVAADYLPRKHKLQIPSKFLFVDSDSARAYVQGQYMSVPNAAPTEAKFIDPAEFPLDAFFVIYADKLAIMTPETMDAVIIRDQVITDALRPFFFFVWKRAGNSMSNLN